MFGCEKLAAVRVSRRKRSRSPTCDANSAGSTLDRKSTRLNSSHTEIYTLSLHDALPILDGDDVRVREAGGGARLPQEAVAEPDLRRELRREHLRSEEHTSELQSHRDLHSFPTRRSSDLRRGRCSGARSWRRCASPAGSGRGARPATRTPPGAP